MWKSMKTLLIILKAMFLAFLVSGSVQAQWTQSSLPVSNQVTDILSYGNVWYVATSNNGIQRTQNFTDWYSSSSGIGTSDIRRIITSVEGSAIVMYASTANGVYRSAMLGYSWSAVNNGLASLNTSAIFSDGTILLVSTAEGVFRSENYGQSWSAVSIGASNQNVRCFLKNGSDLLAGLANTGNYLYRSTDNGLTWSPYGSGLYETNQLAKLDDKLFASSLTLMYQSTDNGLTWMPSSSGLVPGMYIMDMTTFDDYLYVATLAGGYVRHADSSSFRMITQGMPMGGYLSDVVGVNTTNVVFNTANNGLWFADGGVVTTTGMSEWTKAKVFPNPVSEQCCISVYEWLGKDCKIQVLDLSGKSVMKSDFALLKAGEIILDFSSLNPGIYCLIISSGQQILTEKVIKL
jgi:hypothetical protein